MVNPGGESTMLGHWRIVLRQAEEAARAGRYDEAWPWPAGPTWPTTTRPCSSAAGWGWT